MRLFLISIIALLHCGAFTQSNECKSSKIAIAGDKFNLEYNDNGQLEKITDRNGNVFKLSYNEKGELEKSVNFDSDGELYDTYIYYSNKVEQHDEDGLCISYIYKFDEGNPVKIIESYDGDEEVIAELVWKDGNVIEQKEYSKGISTTYKFQYDDKPNVLAILRFYVDFQNLLNYAEIFSKNNILKVTSSNEVLDLPIEYNEQGCVSRMPRNHYGIYKEITY